MTIRQAGLAYWNRCKIRFPFVARTRIGSVVLSGIEQERHRVAARLSAPDEGCDKWAFETAELRDAFRATFAEHVIKA